MAPVGLWRNSSSFVSSLAFCATEIDDFRIQSHTILRTVTHHPLDDLKKEDNLNDEDDLNNKGDLNNEDIPQMDKCRRVYRILPKKLFTTPELGTAQP